MTSLLRQFRAVLRELPRFYADRFDRWVIRTHTPFGWPRREPGEHFGPCPHCKKSWPCPPWFRAVERLGKRSEKRHDPAVHRNGDHFWLTCCDWTHDPASNDPDVGVRWAEWNRALQAHLDEGVA